MDLIHPKLINSAKFASKDSIFFPIVFLQHGRFLVRKYEFFCFAVILLIAFLVVSPTRAASDEGWVSLGFRADWGDTWRSVEFPEKEPTEYEFNAADNSVCARADRSASARIRPLPEGETLPTKLRWEWKVDSVLEDGDARRKSGDDYAARVYVNFDVRNSLSYWEQAKLGVFETFYGQNIPSRSVNFIWANRIDRGTIVPSPYTEYTRLVALRSGGDSTGEWVSESINVEKYYEKIFDEEYKRPHSVAIMTDTDDTQSSSRACYRNLKMK